MGILRLLTNVRLNVNLDNELIYHVTVIKMRGLLF